MAAVTDEAGMRSFSAMLMNESMDRVGIIKASRGSSKRLSLTPTYRRASLAAYSKMELPSK